MSDETLKTFIHSVSEAIDNDSFNLLQLKNKRDKSSDLKMVVIRLVLLKKGIHLSFVYRYPTRDVTKNYLPEKALALIRELIETSFYQADLTTTSRIYLYNDQHKASLKVKELSDKVEVSRTHDKQKSRKLDSPDKAYLKALGIASQSGHILGKKQAKYRQINKYIEILDVLFSECQLDNQVTIMDMGSGKAYLSFALYDYLTTVKTMEVSLKGIEIRPELVDKSNALARDVGFKGLEFRQGAIGTTEIRDVDVLIALHACDTATDEAIAAGIKTKARLIVCSPCCHKQVRVAMNEEEENQHITRHGILKERLAELLTDSIRALIMEAYGYRTKVMEFVSTDHTPKNLLITGIFQHFDPDFYREKMREVEDIKEKYGISYHQLERLVDIPGT